MPMLEDVKKIAEKVTGWSRPKRAPSAALSANARPVRSGSRMTGSSRTIRNWPLVLYRGAVRFPDDLDPAAVFEELFRKQRVGRFWRDGIYDYVHYHSRIHEVLGIARGERQGAVRRTPGSHSKTESGRRYHSARRHRASTPFRKQGFSGDRRLSAVRQIRRMHQQRRPQARPDDHSQSGAAAQRPRLRDQRTAAHSLAVDAVMTAFKIIAARRPAHFDFSLRTIRSKSPKSFSSR